MFNLVVQDIIYIANQLASFLNSSNLVYVGFRACKIVNLSESFALFLNIYYFMLLWKQKE